MVSKLAGMSEMQMPDKVCNEYGVYSGLRRRGTLSRRDFLRMGGAGVVGTALLGISGCGRDESNQGSGSRSLEYWTYSSEEEKYVNEVVGLDLWQSAHPDVKVNVRVFPYDQMYDKLLSALVSGKGAPDVALMEVNSFSRFIKGDKVPLVGLKERLGDESNKLYTSAAIDPFSWNGETYAIGSGIAPVVFAYREDIMNDLGVNTPFETWDAVVDAGNRVATDTESKMFMLHDLHFGDHYMITQNAGGGYVDEEGNLIVDDEKSVMALQFLHDLVHSEEIAGLTPGSSDLWASPEYWAQFQGEQYVASFGPNWHMGSLQSNVPEQSGLWTAQELPQGLGDGRPSATFGGSGPCITEQAQDPDLAWDLVHAMTLTTEGAIANFKAVGAYPSYKPAYEDQALNQPNEYFGGLKLAQLYGSLASEIPATAASPNWSDITDTIERIAVTPVMGNNKEAKSALTDVSTQISS